MESAVEQLKNQSTVRSFSIPSLAKVAQRSEQNSFLTMHKHIIAFPASAYVFSVTHNIWSINAKKETIKLGPRPQSEAWQHINI
jgi:hypothetical protein